MPKIIIHTIVECGPIQRTDAEKRQSLKCAAWHLILRRLQLFAMHSFERLRLSDLSVGVAHKECAAVPEDRSLIADLFTVDKHDAFM
ncbi:hypothetical protein GCM10010869_59130 [Mesorhizobium tianshanense]|nr:hypothetical protein GCM10010869_59130 [Mesorhizobium tianshanense]